MPDQSHSERLDRLEQVVHFLAEDQVSLQKLIGSLATETRKAFDRVAERAVETERHMLETDEHMRQTDGRLREIAEQIRETDARTRATSERIDNLVLAIGELIRRQN
jgi:hypothetical protein